MKGYVRIAEFAALAQMEVSSLYRYNAERLYGFPEPDMVIGVVLFWRRPAAEAWVRGRSNAKRP
jgi:predicted DNA-binding transcriptional regulator AlpA